MKRVGIFVTAAWVFGLVGSAGAQVQQCSQTLPNGYLTVDGPAFLGNPFNSSVAQKWQWVYDSSQFAAQGPITITDIAIRATSPTVAAPSTVFGSFKVRLASSPNNYSSATQNAVFASNLAANQTLCFNGVWATGTITPSGTATANWIQFGLTTPFTFNPGLGQDFVVQVEKCSSASAPFQLDCVSGPAGTVGGNAYGNTSSCTATSRNNSYNETVPIIKIDYAQNLLNQWQTNQPQASMDINGVQNSACSGGPIYVSGCPNAPATIHLNTSLTFPPFDIAGTIGHLNALLAGGFSTPSGQIVNVNLADPTFFLLNGGVFQPLPPLSIPLTLSSPGGFSAQMIVIDPSSPDGLRLSAGNELRAVAPTLQGPVGDDNYTTFVTGSTALCGPATVPFYGTSYTQVHVQSNGRCMFGTSGMTNDITPSAANAMIQNGAVGAWVDLSPPTGGSIFITSPGFNLFRASWASVPYYGQPLNVTNWYIELDGTTGAITISGLANFPVAAPTALNMFIGLSSGQYGPATDPGAVTYALGGPYPGPALATDMLYAIGPAGTLTPGINTLIFVPNSLGNYDYTALP